MGAQGGGAGSGGACGDDASAAAAVGRMVHRWGGGATARPARAAAPGTYLSSNLPTQLL